MTSAYLPNSVTFFFLLRNFLTHPCSLLTHSCNGHSWETIMAWRLGFESVHYYHLIVQAYAGQPSGSQFHHSQVYILELSSQWRQEIYLLVHFHIHSARHRAWHLIGAQNVCWINWLQSTFVRLHDLYYSNMIHQSVHVLTWEFSLPLDLCIPLTSLLWGF